MSTLVPVPTEQVSSGGQEGIRTLTLLNFAAHSECAMSTKVPSLGHSNWYPEQDSNLHAAFATLDSHSSLSTKVPTPGLFIVPLNDEGLVAIHRIWWSKKESNLQVFTADLQSAGLTTCPITPSWCERGESNPHEFPRWSLNPVRLPVPPRSHSTEDGTRTHTPLQAPVFETSASTKFRHLGTIFFYYSVFSPQRKTSPGFGEV